jgi:NitT/TauT family transport system substrate-binding protein
MSPLKVTRITIPLCMGLAVLLINSGPISAARHAPSLRKVTFMLDTNYLPKHGLFFAAKGLGFYRAEGLDVDFQPSTGSLTTASAVSQGKADFGFADFDTMVKVDAQGGDDKQLATIHAQSPFAVITLLKYHIHSWKDLVGKTVAGEPGGSATIFFPLELQLCGVNPNAVHLESVDSTAKLPGLLAGKWQAFVAYSVSDPATMIGMGLHPVVLLGSQCGFKLYSNGLIASDRMIKSDPSLVGHFVKATVEGVKWACDNQNAAAKNTLQFVPAMNLKAARAGIKLACQIIWTPAARKYGLGYMTKDEVIHTMNLARRFLQLTSNLKPEDVYTDRFIPHILPDTHIKPPRS